MSWDHHVNTLRYRHSLPGLATYADGEWSTARILAEKNLLTGLPATVIRADLPRLSEGWEYRSYQIPIDSQGFLRTGITGPPEP
jgi:hypothetical protein